jgi:hypothetical protein
MKRIILEFFGPLYTYRATSRRFGISAYGRTVAEAKQRLFLTMRAEQSNRGAFYSGLILGVVRDWKHPLDIQSPM